MLSESTNARATRVAAHASAETKRTKADAIIDNLLKEIPGDGATPRERKRMNEVLR